MAFDFPASPTEGQEFTPAGGPTYVWNTPSWKAKATTSLYVAKAGDTMTGSLLIDAPTPTLSLASMTAAGTNKANTQIYKANDQYILRLLNSGAVTKAQELVDVSTGRIYLDAPGDLILRGAVNGGAQVIAAGPNTMQLQFPATPAFSAGATVLDDYREGTWVPSLRIGGATTGITASSSIGYYVRIGSTVFAGFDIQLTNKGALTGAVDVAGLPYAAAGITPNIVSGYYTSMASLSGGIVAYISGGSFNLSTHSAAAISGLSNGHLTNTSRIIMSGSYLASF